MARFAFIVHPLSKGDITRRYRLLQFLPLSLIELLLICKKPSIIGATDPIHTAVTGPQWGIDGLFVAVPLTPRMLKRLPVWFVNRRILQAIQLGRKSGAQVAGLGALTACVGDSGITLNERSRIPVTTGNTYTVATVVEAAAELTERFFGHIPRKQRVLGLAGASGSIGQTCLELLKPLFGHVVLLSRSSERGYKVASDFCLADTHGYSVVLSAHHLRQAHVVVSVTSSDTTIIGPADISAGTLVIDVARPRDVSVRMQDRDDVLVIEGGVVAVPGLPDLGLDFGFPPGHCYACMAETMMDALEGYGNNGDCRASTVGKSITVDDVARQQQRAKKHSFKLAGYRSFERPVSEAMLEKFSVHADRRQPCRVTCSYHPD